MKKALCLLIASIMVLSLIGLWSGIVSLECL